MSFRWNHHSGKARVGEILLIMLLALCISYPQATQAATIDVPCNVTDLVNAINTANTNGEADTLNLAPACTYTFVTLDILADGGNPMTIEGNGATISGNNTVRVFFVDPGATLSLNAVTVSNGFTAFSGGGIANAGTLTLTNSAVFGNTATNNGGGILNINAGTLTLINSTVSINTASDAGGGILNFDGTLTIIDSTLSGNSAGGGGGIANEGTATLTNSTLSGNSAGVDGGGIFNGGTAILTNTTLSGNSAGTRGGGIYNLDTLTLINSIIANSASGGDCRNASTITSSGGNLIEDGSCSVAGALLGEPMLGSLTGSPGYFPLLPGSPAIDTGDNSVCLATDQRGTARPFDGDGDGTATCDLGSYELDTVTTPATPTPTSPFTATPTLAVPVATLPPPPDTPRCEDLNFVADGVVRASVSDALDYAVYCRVLYANSAPVQWLGGDLYNAGSIGHQGVIDLGVVQAVDVYSPVGMTTFDGGVEICLKGTGTLIFMAASGAPRVPEVVGSRAIDDFPGFTCVTLFEPGTLVLVRNAP
jgi:hypothetical protein